MIKISNLNGDYPFLRHANLFVLTTYSIQKRKNPPKQGFKYLIIMLQQGSARQISTN